MMQFDPAGPAGEDTNARPIAPAPGEPSAAATSTAHIAGRLHPLALLFDLLGLARGFLLPLIPLLLFGGGASWMWTLVIVGIFSLVRVLVRYFSFSYRIEQGELITREGVIGRTERHIRLERVQEIRIEQGLLHRLFGVVEAKVETAGSSGPEATFPVLSRAEAEALRGAVFAFGRGGEARGSVADSAEGAGAIEGAAAADGAGAADGASSADGAAAAADIPASISAKAAATASRAPVSEILCRLSVRDLTLAGLTSNHLVSAFIFLGAIWALVDDVLPETIYEQLARSVNEAAGELASQGARAAVMAVIFLLIAIILTGMLLSVIGSIALFYGFTLERRGEDLHRSYGLLTRRSSSLPRRRIQVLAIEEGLLRRLAGLAALRVETVSGRSDNNSERREGRDRLLPIARREVIDELLPVIFPDLDESEWRRVSPLAIRRSLTKTAIFGLVVAGAAIYLTGSWWSLAAIAILPLSYPVIRRRYESLGYALGERYFRARRGWLGRLTQIVPIRKVQVLEIRETPFDRRLGLSTLVVDTAGQSPASGGTRVANLERAEAEHLARRLAHEAAATEYRV